MKTARLPIALAIATLPFSLYAQETTLPRIVVKGVGEQPAAQPSVVDPAELSRRRAATSDTASLLSEVPGVSLYGAGGVSSLPAIHGLADDRLRIQVDGMDLIASCPNHMNPALSYVDPTNVGDLKVYAGISPVSVGGDNFKTSTATGRPGHALALDEVGSTAYETRNHTLGFAFKGGNHLLEAKLGYQDMPYQLYPNQRMDMLNNEQTRLNLRYLGQFDWGSLEARAYHEKVDHFMDFGADKQYFYGALPNLNNPSITYPVPGMPMYTQGTTRGLSLQGEVRLSQRDLLRVGGMLQTYRLDDWWPPAPDCGVGNCIGGMAPLTFWNVNDGQRDRKALYGEWEAKWTSQWSSLLGLRVEDVTTNTGTVTGYNSMALPGATNLSGMGIPLGSMYAGSSVAPGPGGRDAFNAMDRKRADTNWDLTAMASYRPGETFDLQFGFARKTRSPNLYERYSWSSNTMAMVMNNFVGDGNGYIGNPDLKPETAHTLSLTGDWHSADRDYQFVATPYYTRVNDYIDARRTYPGSAATNAMATNSFVKLQYVNQEARLYGIDLSNEIKTPGYSLVNLRGSYSWQKVRVDVGVDNLFDKRYFLPLGGAYVGQGMTMSITGVPWGIAVPGIGRSLYAGLNVKF